MPQFPYDFDRVIEPLDVSRETKVRLYRYGQMLEDWQGRFNLVGPRTLPEMWSRHFLDSIQLLNLIDHQSPVWLDFGSGAGFPGLVAAILLADREGGTVHLVDSTAKKCRFLEEVARETLGDQRAVEVIVHHDRVENLDPFISDVVSARAVTALKGLLGYAFPFFGDRSVGLFPKGQDVDNELTEAAKYWNIDLDKYPSHTDDRGVLLRIKGLSPKG